MHLRPELGYCRGSDSIQEGFSMTERLLLDGAWRPDDCICPQPCHRTSYEYRGDTSDDRTDNSTRIKVQWGVTKRLGCSEQSHEGFDVLSESTVHCHSLHCAITLLDHCAITVALIFDQLPIAHTIERKKKQILILKMLDYINYSIRGSIVCKILHQEHYFGLIEAWTQIGLLIC